MIDERLTAVRVWDLPTRAFHWTLALCVVASVTSAQIGGNAMVWHFRFGYVVFTLLAFRILWGVVGGRWSRFSSFLYAPNALMRYVRGASRDDEHHDVGHSPLGALSVFGMLALLAAQVGTGLFADDEISNTGPLIGFVSGDTTLALTGWHKNYGQWLIVGIVVLHVAAIAVYFFRNRRNLWRSMIGGDKRLAAATPASADGPRSRALALLLLALCAAAVAWVVGLGG
ncbi:MAG: cytochrome b/b6 domain-containing protein [Burkholderiaceae bacterium]